MADDSLAELDNLPPPQVIAREIVEELTAALAGFEGAAGALEASSGDRASRSRRASGSGPSRERCGQGYVKAVGEADGLAPSPRPRGEGTRWPYAGRVGWSRSRAASLEGDSDITAPSPAITPSRRQARGDQTRMGPTSRLAHTA